MLLLGRGWLDRDIYRALYAGGRPGLVLTALIFTGLGEPTVLVAAALLWAAWLWRNKRGGFAAGVLLVTLVGRGLTEAQKYWIARARPDLDPHLVVVKSSSFPSGHATSSMIFYLTLVLTLRLAPRQQRVAAACAILLSFVIGTSRVMLGVHWPSDVVGGWSFGALWVLLSLPFAERLFARDSGASANAVSSRERNRGRLQ